MAHESLLIGAMLRTIAELSIVVLDNIKLDINSRVLEGMALKLGSCQISSSLAKCSNLIELSFV